MAREYWNFSTQDKLNSTSFKLLDICQQAGRLNAEIKAKTRQQRD